MVMERKSSVMDRQGEGGCRHSKISYQSPIAVDFVCWVTISHFEEWIYGSMRCCAPHPLEWSTLDVTILQLNTAYYKLQ